MKMDTRILGRRRVTKEGIGLAWAIEGGEDEGVAIVGAVAGADLIEVAVVAVSVTGVVEEVVVVSETGAAEAVAAGVVVVLTIVSGALKSTRVGSVISDIPLAMRLPRIKRSRLMIRLW